MNHKVKVLIIDDSISYRQILSAVIDKIADAECIGTAASGSIALRKIAAQPPDLVLLDVVMPEMDGVEILQQIKQHYPAVEAIMISSFDMQSAKETLRSLQIGALDFIAKPVAANQETGLTEWVNYLKPFIHLVQTKKYAAFSRRLHSDTTHKIPTPAQKTQPTATSLKAVPQPTSGRRKFDLIVIGVSTGGPKALAQLIPALNSAMPCPIIIVQHMPPVFTETLALNLAHLTRLQVSEAKGGEKPAAGHIYIAPGGKHLVLHRHTDNQFYLALHEQPPVNNCRPSVDVLFSSVAQVFKGNVLAVIMTGMGRDGTEGMKLLKRPHNKCLIQDQESSIVWGMPGSVFEAGLADEIVPLAKLADRINSLVL